MREIKFRIWDKNMKRWWCEDSQYLQMDGKKIHPAPWSTLSADLPDDSIIIQQYTGLKDKNGKEIYEGDILERIGNGSFMKIVISWDSQNCCFVSKNVHNLHGEGFPISNNSINISDWTYWVVCGNIFENLELLND